MSDMNDHEHDHDHVDPEHGAANAAPLTINATIARAPLPTRRTLRRRQNLVVQAWRFAALNLRMGLLTMRSHE